MSDSLENNDQVSEDSIQLRTEPFEELLTKNYKMFTIVSVFGALTVYLFNLRNQVPNRYVDWGVAGALLMFLISSLTIVHKLSYRLANHDDIAWTYRTLTAVILFGLIAVMYSILGVAVQFLGEVVMLSMFISAIVVVSVYDNIFPWEKFRDVGGVSEETAEKIKNAPHVANTWAVTAILLSGIVIPSLPKVDGYSPLYIIPALVIWIVIHTLLSFALRRRYLSKESKVRKN